MWYVQGKGGVKVVDAKGAVDWEGWCKEGQCKAGMRIV